MLIEILVRRTDDPHIDLHRLAAADPLDDLVLQEAQQLDLHRQRHIADFVEKQRAAIGAFDPADILLHRAGEGPLLVAEELAFEQCLGDGGAVDRDERRRGAPAQLVDRLRQQLLAGAALAEQQYRNVGRRDLFDVAQHLQHFRAARDDSVDRRGRSAFR